MMELENKKCYAKLNLPQVCPLPAILTSVDIKLSLMLVIFGKFIVQFKSTRTGSLTLIGLRMSTLVLLPLLTVVFGMINGCCVVILTALQVNTAPTTLLTHVTLRSSPE